MGSGHSLPGPPQHPASGRSECVVRLHAGSRPVAQGVQTTPRKNYKRAVKLPCDEKKKGFLLENPQPYYLKTGGGAAVSTAASQQAHAATLSRNRK